MCNWKKRTEKCFKCILDNTHAKVLKRKTGSVVNLRHRKAREKEPKQGPFMYDLDVDAKGNNTKF